VRPSGRPTYCVVAPYNQVTRSDTAKASREWIIIIFRVPSEGWVPTWDGKVVANLPVTWITQAATRTTCRSTACSSSRINAFRRRAGNARPAAPGAVEKVEASGGLPPELSPRILKPTPYTGRTGRRAMRRCDSHSDYRSSPLTEGGRCSSPESRATHAFPRT
jgi:hypothetical protein